MARVNACPDTCLARAYSFVWTHLFKMKVDHGSRDAAAEPFPHPLGSHPRLAPRRSGWHVERVGVLHWTLIISYMTVAEDLSPENRARNPTRRRPFRLTTLGNG